MWSPFLKFISIYFSQLCFVSLADHSHSPWAPSSPLFYLWYLSQTPPLALSLSLTLALSLPLIGCSWFQIIAAVYCWGALLYIKGQSLKWRGRMLIAMIFNGYLLENIYEKWKTERGQKEVCWIDKSLHFSEDQTRIISLRTLEISVFVWVTGGQLEICQMGSDIKPQRGKRCLFNQSLPANQKAKLDF